MGFRFRRSIKLLPGIRLNVGKRGMSTSIGVRGAHVTFGSSGTRTTIGLPGSGLSYTHLERPHRRPPTAAVEQPSNPALPQGSARRGYAWIGLIVGTVVVVIAEQTTTAPPEPIPVPTRPPTEIVAKTAAQTARDERLAEIKTAAVGVTQISHAVANSNTLNLSRVTVMPIGTICYQFHLRNSRGETYVRTAMMEGAVMKVSGSDGFTPLWNRRCTQKSGRDITSDVIKVIRLHDGRKATFAPHGPAD
jgi:hypothetical protein